MTLDREERMLVDALKAHAKGGTRPDFPFDCPKFTMEQAARAIERRQAELSEGEVA